MTLSPSLRPIGFADLPGWAGDDHAAAFAAFRRSALRAATEPPRTRSLGVDGAALALVAAEALTVPQPLDGAAARAFFERCFVPHRVEGDGFFTGFYEPEVEARLQAEPGFAVPLLRPPEELVEIDEASPPPGLPAGMRFARRTGDGYQPFFDRREIESGALAGRGLELAFLADPADAFFIHVQGAARLRLGDGTTRRVTYAAKSGHDYTPVGCILIESGALPRGGVTMQTIRAWLAARPQQGREAMWGNRSYIFFREAPVDDPALGPIAAAKVPLTDGRSLAVDRTLHTFHAPVWIETRLPEEEGGGEFRRLMIAQDTGSAILGPARGDIFFGSGEAAGRIAGRMQARGSFTVLVPRGSA